MKRVLISIDIMRLKTTENCGNIFIYMLPVAGEVGKERLRPDLTGSGNMKGEQDEQL